MPIARPQLSHLAALLLALALLGGCGGDNGTTQPPATATARPSGTAPPNATADPPLTSSTVTEAQSTAMPRHGAARTPPAQTSSAIAASEQEVVRRINAIRRERGLQPLATNDALGQIARDYSCLMAREDFFSHTSPTNGIVADRVREANIAYRQVGENLARNTNATDPVVVAVQGWMDSPGHRENILRESFTETGVGICREGSRYYFTQIFLQPR